MMQKVLAQENFKAHFDMHDFLSANRMQINPYTYFVIDSITLTRYPDSCVN